MKLLSIIFNALKKAKKKRKQRKKNVSRRNELIHSKNIPEKEESKISKISKISEITNETTNTQLNDLQTEDTLTSNITNYILPKYGLTTLDNNQLFKSLKEDANQDYRLPLLIGEESGRFKIVDLSKTSHILIGGATLTGKSTLIHSMIASLLFIKHPSEVKLVLIDSKGLEFNIYKDLQKTFLAKFSNTKESVISDYSQAISSLNSLVIEANKRIDLLKKEKAINIETYNKNIANRNQSNHTNEQSILPYIVVFIDEFSPLVTKEFETAISTIGLKGASTGIYMILSTSQILSDILKPKIRQQFSLRIAFKTLSASASNLLIGNRDSYSKLNNTGEAIYWNNLGDNMKITTLYHSYEEITDLVNFINNQQFNNKPYIIDNSINAWEYLANYGERDPLFEEVAELVVTSGMGSTSGIQRRYSIGYNRAGKIMEQLENYGIVGPSNGGKPRQVLVNIYQLEYILNKLK